MPTPVAASLCRKSRSFTIRHLLYSDESNSNVALSYLWSCLQKRQVKGGLSGSSSGRKNAGAADHVDILGNHKVLEDILRIASGNGEDLDDAFWSNILEIARRIPRGA
ncbi:hypothetical protein SeMB42_g06102 [Synchytrium endobioticum]|uniref:Uncharacterized protein n=1 Tax=Synchytrium endobioticum TaxID=286115 RepID=A0A507CKH7_9FUNG|nr:hypothetical protein SeMB42_g06102 [Synchytrium endobioticum]